MEQKEQSPKDAVRFLQIIAQSKAPRQFSMPLLFLPSAPGDHNVCPITHDEIGAETYVTPYCRKRKKDEGCPPVLSKHPHLHCIQIMECKHCFDARALVVHFLCNAMNCPLCRAGDPDAILSAKHTFADENWILHADLKIQEDRERQRRHNTEDHPPRFIINRLLHSHNLVMTVFLYDSLEHGARAVLGMQFPLELGPIQPLVLGPPSQEPESILVQTGSRLLPLSQVQIEYSLSEEALRTIALNTLQYSALAVSLQVSNAAPDETAPVERNPTCELHPIFSSLSASQHIVQQQHTGSLILIDILAHGTDPRPQWKIIFLPSPHFIHEMFLS